MLETLNRYCHGYVVVPVVAACRRGGFFDLLEEKGPLDRDLVAQALGANSGHLQSAVRLMESLGWVVADGEGLRLTERAEERRDIPDTALELVGLPLEQHLKGGGVALAPWIQESARRWDARSDLMADFLDGVLVIRLLTALRRVGALGALREGPEPLLARLSPSARDDVVALFTLLEWVDEAEGQRRYTDAGRFMVDRALTVGVLAAYTPMLSKVTELIFGDPGPVFARGAGGQERHLDRDLNVAGSGFQHERYFAEVEEVLLSIFDRTPISGQPRYVADMGCGDGTFLKRIYETVSSRSVRGRHLHEHPLRLVGVDLNAAALEATSRTLRGLPHVVVEGDIGDPEALNVTLAARGIDPAEVLHVRSFLDHDRPFAHPEDVEAASRREAFGLSGVHVDERGGSISPGSAMQSLVEHLRRWAGAGNRHGLVVLEVHCLPPVVTLSHLDAAESLHFDAYHAFSMQHLDEARTFLLAAAEAGLFPRIDSFRRYPKTLAFARITLSHLERRPFSVRPALGADVEDLVELEVAAWPEGLRASADELERRLRVDPGRQLVLEHEGRIVAAIYTQRVGGSDAVGTVAYEAVATLRKPDGPVVQLLGLCVHPEARAMGLADELLELALCVSRVESGVERVVGVTRCRDFGRHRGGSMEEYVRRRDESGKAVDSMIRFHEHHGARVRGVVEGYRPGDGENLGAGVLVEYDFDDLGRGARPPEAQAPSSPRSELSVPDVVEEAVRRVLGPERSGAYRPERPLRDMGFDSMDVMEVKTLIARRLDLDLEATLFFRHRTPRAVAEHLARRLSGTEPGDDPAPRRGRGRATPSPRSSPRSSRNDRTRAAAAGEGIAIVGLAGRFAGARTTDEYWDLLQGGRHGVTNDPPERWDWRRLGEPATAVRSAGFLDQVDRFDAAFFGISPREARRMDPQQRMLLETAWHALEDAGIDPEALTGSATGVFVGLASHDYELLQVRSRGDAAFDAHFASGNAAAVAAGRLSYLLGLQGPALSIDTACSASLVAVHQATQSLRLGECDLALAGGVNVLLAPEMSLVYARARMLSPEGRCKTFDASADGYVRSEGCGVVVLKRLQDALADGDPVLAVVRGSAINQDGPSNGLTAPNGDAQEAVIRQALNAAGVAPAEVSYVEAHGTGTSLGDPIEVAALGRAYGPGRAAESPLVISTAKTTIGHAEAAAGVAGLIKTVLSLRHERIPPHLHLKDLNPLIHLEQIPAAVPTEGLDWPRDERRPRLAGVSSFGFSGTNAHVIVEEAPVAASTRPEATAPAHLLVLSARSETALAAQADSYRSFLLSQPPPPIDNVCFAASIGRAHLEHRLAVVGETVAELADALAVSDGGRSPSSARRHSGRADPSLQPSLAFLFSGQGAQHPGMGRQLYESQASFRQTLEECNEILRHELSVPLLSVLFPDQGEEAIRDTSLLQPALFALEYALGRLWASWGIEPQAVLGHSLGEYAAACMAGVFDLEDGLRLVATRGRLMGGLAEKGAMLAVAASEPQVAAAVESLPDLAIACLNAPSSVVISGRSDAVSSAEELFASQGIRTRRLSVSHAFHSPLMDPILDEFEAAVAGTTLNAPHLTFVSNLYGRVVTEEVTTPAYWRRHLREAVRFADGIGALVQTGAQAFVEVGPGRTLVSLGQLTAAGEGLVWRPTLVPEEAEWLTVLDTLGTLHVNGARVDWGGVHQDHRSSRVPLPLYPFERERFWFDDETQDSPSVEAPPAVPRSVPSPAAPPVVSGYYDALASAQEGTDLRYLNFAPFPEVVPGFSWVLALGLPQSHSDELRMFVDAQQEMRRILFRHTDLGAASRVFDIGCGYGSDLLDLARAHPQLQLGGFSLSERQVEVARRTAREEGVADRLDVARKDSARDALPSDNDVVFGFEVAHHIRDKKALFANVSRHLRDDGWLLLADFVSTTTFAIDHPATSSFFPTRGEWVELLATNGLEAVECVDVSPEVANSLHDPDFEANLATVLEKGGDESVREAFTSYDQLGRLLRKGLALYVLLSARRRSDLPVVELRRRNEAVLGLPLGFGAVSVSGSCYAVDWTPAEPPAAATGPRRRWAFLEDGRGIGEALAKRLGSDHQSSPRLGSTSSPDELSAAVESWSREGVTDVVHMWSLDAAPNEDLTPETLRAAGWLGCGSLLKVAQSLVDAPASVRPRLWVVTRGIHPAGEAPVHLAASSLSGFVRTLRLEHPEVSVTSLDMDPAVNGSAVEGLVAELGREVGPTELALRGGERLTPRLVRTPLAPERRLELRPDATYLIAGGLGDLGLWLARSMARAGAGHLVLVSRRPPSEAAASTIREIERDGTRVVTHGADVSRRGDVQRLFEDVGRSLPPVRGVVNTAGVTEDGVLRDLDPEQLARVMAPKVEGSLWLHEASLPLELDFFCGFSSVASVLGSPGQAHYAAANSFVDALAHHQRGQEVSGLSVSWGAWGELGMAARLSPEHRQRLASRGLGEISPAEGIRVLFGLLGSEAPHRLVSPMDWSRYVDGLPGGESLELLSQVAPRPLASSADGKDGVLAEMDRAPVARRRESLDEYVRLQVAKVIGSYSAASVDPDKGFWAMGLDSLMSLELRNRLQVGLQQPLPATLTLDYPNVSSLVAYLTTGAGASVPSPSPSTVAAPGPAPSRGPALESLSEDETEALLLSKLKELEY